MDISEVIAAVGKMDKAELDAVFAAYRNRGQALRTEASITGMATFKPGDRVTLAAIKPRYLEGLKGTVAEGTARRAASIPVIIDEGDMADPRLAKYINRTTRTVQVPASCLKALAAVA